MKKYHCFLFALFFATIVFNFKVVAKTQPEGLQAHFNQPLQKGLSDAALMTLVQKQTFGYFWDFAHPVSGMARERSNVAYGYGGEVVTTGGTGFGVMAMVVAAERGWVTRDSIAQHLLKMVKFLSTATSYHGVFPHWMNGATGKTIPFSTKDDGADLVETSYLFQGLLCARQYFDRQNATETGIRSTINT